MQPLAEHTDAAPTMDTPVSAEAPRTPPVAELGGPTGPEPTRFGDWERRGRCIDF
jgi:hypothetical protein